jgi:hypothetical protein
MRVPDTRLATEAGKIVTAALSTAFLNHSLRAFHLGRAYAGRNDVTYDDEGLYLAALFHDVGFFEPYASGERSFQLDSSRALRSFLEEKRFPPDRISPLVDAIDFHLQLAPRWSKGNVAGLLQIGTWMDVTFLRRWGVAAEAREIAAALPRAGLDLEFPKRLLKSMRTLRSCVGLISPARYRP